jgi:hypothetical protein
MKQQRIGRIHATRFESVLHNTETITAHIASPVPAIKKSAPAISLNCMSVVAASTLAFRAINTN